MFKILLNSSVISKHGLPDCGTLLQRIIIFSGTCFSFGASQQNAYAKLEPLCPMNLGSFTMDFYVTLAQRPKGSSPHFISYATAKSFNELLLGSSGTTHINSRLVIGGKNANYPAVNR
jgi:hypothetical protein